MVSAAILAAAGLIACAIIFFPGNFRTGAKGQRKELLQFWESGLYEEVFNQSKAALAARPMDYFLLTMQGFSAYQLGISQVNKPDAENYFNECIWSLRKALLMKNALNDGRLYYVLGKAYSYKGESYADLAVKYLENAKGLNYRAADIPEYLGMAYALLGDYRSSVEAFSEALGTQGFTESRATGSASAGKGPSGPLFFSIAKSYFALEEFDTARTYLQRCIEVSSDFQTVLSARLLLAEILKITGDYDRAVQLLTEILAETGGNAEVHYQIGELFALQGDTVRARAEWRLALRTDPAHIKARTRLAM